MYYEVIFLSHIQVDTFFNRIQLRATTINANYVQRKIFPLHRYRFFAPVEANPSSEKQTKFFDLECCFFSDCYKKSKGECFTFNWLLEQKTNNEVLDEPVSFITLYYVIQLDIEKFKPTIYDCCFF